MLTSFKYYSELTGFYLFYLFQTMTGIILIGAQIVPSLANGRLFDLTPVSFFFNQIPIV